MNPRLPGEPESADEGRPASRGRLGLAAAVLAATVILFLPAAAELPPAGQRMAAIFVVAVILWATEALPVAVTSLLVVVLQPVLGAASLRAAFTSFISPVFFFVFAMFCLAAAITTAGLDRRFALFLLDRARADSRRTVVALMLGTAAISTIMSDVPACAIFMVAGLGVLERAGIKPGDSSLGKAIMIGVPIASLIGGVATPAGSSVNIIGIHFIEEYGKVRVGFLQWMLIGVPMVLLLVPVACWAVLRWFPPEVEKVGDFAETRRQRLRLGAMSSPEKKTLLLLGAMMVLWILGTWVEQLDVVLVALIGALAMFLPGVELLSWPQANRLIAWDTLLMIGGVTSIGAASVETGLARWLVGATLGGMVDWPLVVSLLAISAFTVVIHLALPIGPVVNAVVIPPIVLLAQATGHHPAMLALPVAFTASCAFLLPLDAVALITYAKGYYRMRDMLAPGSLISIVWIVWITLLMLVLGPYLGMD